MFDGVTLTGISHDTCNTLVEHDSLKFGSLVNVPSGEILNTKQTAIFGGITITVYGCGRFFLRGSLHTLYNFIYFGVCENFDDYTYEKLLLTLQFLEDEFGINLEKTEVHSIEFGVNIVPSIPINNILDNCTIFKSIPFSKMKINGKGNGIEAFSLEYGIKLYDKSLQYKLKINLLRFEIKVRKMRSHFKEKLYLANLLDEKIWERCGISLINTLDNILMTEKIDLTKLSKEELIIYLEFTNAKHINTLSRINKHRKKIAFQDILETHGKLNIKHNLIESIKNKIIELSNFVTISPNIKKSECQKLDRKAITNVTISPFRY